MEQARSHSAKELAEAIVAQVGPEIRLALPLGLGKPVTLLNALTDIVAQRPDLKLTIFTALTLERPAPSNAFAERLLSPAQDRLFGTYPQIDYARRLREGRLPPNIAVREFFLLAGRWLGVPEVQQSYVSANYTHALDVLVAQRPNLVLQLVALMDEGLSLSCNTDITADLLELRRRGEADFVLAVETNPELPPMGGGAVIDEGEAAFRLDPRDPFELFSAVRQPVGNTEHAIGLHVSRLIPDGGTLQIGIGSLGDAVAHALLLRAKGQLDSIWAECPLVEGRDVGEAGRFETGLYAVTEMLVEGVLQLFEADVIRRRVEGAAIHAGFFVETRDFYRRLRGMPPERRNLISMVPVSFTNALYHDESAKRAARTKARFVNAAMQATVFGEIASDTTDDGQVVSGVGGQFNFVEQAFALEGARAVITLPATRTRRGKAQSNIVWSHAHLTVPRHMRDIVVTEYGIADLRGKSDAEVIAAMLEITDSRFQGKLQRQAKGAGKLPEDYEIPRHARDNTPRKISDWLGPYRDGLLPAFPFGTDFSETEQRLLPALNHLKENRGSLIAMIGIALAGLGVMREDEVECLERMGLAKAKSLTDLALATLLRGALRKVRP